MVIDPLETLITWLETALTSASGRVAGKHRYGGGWSESQLGVSVHLDGGAVDLYVPVSTPRLEIRIYDDDQVGIVSCWRELVGLCRSNSRFSVVTSQGTALVQYVLPITSLSLLYDPVIGMDMGVVFVETMIAEEAIS